MLSCKQANKKKECKKVIENKETCNQTYTFTYKKANFKKNIQVTQTGAKRLKTLNTPASFQTYKYSNNIKQLIKIKKRNNKSQVIKYITYSKTKHPKPL